MPDYTSGARGASAEEEIVTLEESSASATNRTSRSQGHWFRRWISRFNAKAPTEESPLLSQHQLPTMEWPLLAVTCITYTLCVAVTIAFVVSFCLFLALI